ncbi:MAG: glutaredoxin domain-containing protein [Candidatus Paceibacterota bacterium]
MIKIYSTPFCPYCSTLKDYLKDKKVNFTEVDVSEDEKERNEMIELSGQIGVPVVNVDGKIIVGFDKEQIDEVLKLK